MLVLTRKPGEKVMIGHGIELTVLAVPGDRVRLGVSAPPTVAVDRWEVWRRREAPRLMSCTADAK